MLSLKNRSSRSSSTLISSLLHNKENAIDLGNRLHRRPTKISRKESTQDSLNEVQVKKPNRTHVCLEPAKEDHPRELKESQSNKQPIKMKLSLETLKKKIQEEPINIKEIESAILRENHGEDILHRLLETSKSQQLRKILVNHQISKELRSKMVDWIIEVMSSYKYNQTSFFTAVRIMDTFFMKTSAYHCSSDLHLVGVACIFIACKYEEIYPLKLRVIHEKIAHRKLSKEEIIKKEGEIMSVLNFDLVGTSCYEIVKHLIYSLNLSLEPRHLAYLEKVIVYLCKMVQFDSQIVGTYDSAVLALACLHVSFKIIEQVDGSFKADREIKRASEMLNIMENESVEAAGKVLNLAKSFETTYPTLTNLKKFNGFSSAMEGSLTERPGSNQ